MSNSSPIPVVSVIVPCFNYGEFLGEALESIMKQTFTDWECLVIDNGSTDNTKEVVQNFMNADKRFHYLFHENKGVSVARNIAIKKSIGKYILPLDADDRIGHEYFKDAINVLEKNTSLKIVYCEAMRFGEINEKWDLPDFSMKELLKENSIFCSAFFRRIDYDKTKGYNEEMLIGFEDWDFWLELLKEGGEVYKIPKILFYYRTRKSSRNNVLDEEKQRLLRNQIYRNHKDLYDKYINVADVLLDLRLSKILLSGIYSSRDFKLGNMLLSPLRKLKSLFS